MAARKDPRPTPQQLHLRLALGETLLDPTQRLHDCATTRALIHAALEEAHERLADGAPAPRHTLPWYGTTLN